MIVYGSSLSPFVRKVLCVCAEKGVTVENVRAGPGLQPPPGFAEASPFGRIPALRDGDYLLHDSSAICWYLEALHPEPPLVPAEPRARGRVVAWDEFADTELFRVAVKSFWNRVAGPLSGAAFDVAAAERAEREELPAMLDHLERELPEDGWLVGDAFSLADAAVGATLLNPQLAGVSLGGAARPRLGAYVERVHARPSLQPLVASARARGRVVAWDEFADTELFRVGVKSFWNRVAGPLSGGAFDVAAAERAEREELPAVLDHLERELPDDGWLVGDAFSLADAAVGATLLNHQLAGVSLGGAARPRLGAYVERVHARPSLQPLVASARALLERVRDRLPLADKPAVA